VTAEYAMQIIYGMNPLLETLHGDPGGLFRIVIASGKKGAAVEKVLEMASRHRIEVLFQGHDSLDRLAGCNHHQGVVALCREHRYASLDEVMANRHPDLQGDLILVVDGVMDPQNLGALIRTAHCFGANGVIIPSHRAAAVTPAVVKASAGAVRHIPVAMAVNLGQVMDDLKEREYWIYGADVNADQEMGDMRFEGRIGLVVGSEGKGIRSLIRKKCDFLFSVPMAGKIDSLNVSVAAGIMFYAIFKALKRRT
jgi:23S rRNA (guanosine2251-2'-O)-methyltransferase